VVRWRVIGFNILLRYAKATGHSCLFVDIDISQSDRCFAASTLPVSRDSPLAERKMQEK